MLLCSLLLFTLSTQVLVIFYHVPNFLFLKVLSLQNCFFSLLKTVHLW